MASIILIIVKRIKQFQLSLKK